MVPALDARGNLGMGCAKGAFDVGNPAYFTPWDIIWSSSHGMEAEGIGRQKFGFVVRSEVL
jgi:hypothetical protein